ncbi:MAG: COX15/CtaA family protein [Thermoplasmata archaeon]
MDGHRAFRYASLAAVTMCWVTIILGGNVIASGSGLGCSTWPSCDGTYFPALTGAMGIEWIHRLSALFLALVILVLLGLALVYERRRPAVLRLSIGAFALVVILALLGGAVVDADLNIGLVLLHFGTATVLFGVLLVLALIVNWKFIPQRWRAWAERETPPLPADGEAPAPVPRPSERRDASISPEPTSSAGHA